MYILFDIGGTNTRVVRSNDLKVFSDVVKYETPKDFAEGISKLVATAQRLAGGEYIEAAAGGIAGPLDAKKTMAVGGPNIPGYHEKPLKSELESHFGAPVHIENDASMGTLGEANFGAGKGYRVVVYMTISTGVGGAQTVNGALSSSSKGFEPGWQIIDAGNTLCSGCSEYGYLIDYISGASVEKRHGKKPYEITDKDFWENKARLLAYGLNNLAVIWSPDIIILGGSMMKTIGIPVESVRRCLKEVLHIFSEPPIIEKAVLGDELGLYGAMAYIAQKKTP
ncbi:MAG: hypothetical protein COZ49_00965 [Candidatus Yonathbacteria bacterium CG_4_10_14_3_um_filter_47_65]|uniref:ROK family protein n=2 Tax=Parcubacteria group TaxID=1794811 RepID=A0A2M8D6V0_9BACT|nr:MAG: hypothetical protein AUJ44_03375 [Candidatus Nomurabacteria bacterium CG1_02_47_685]PIP03223.1 MAG: hypothetical protein COX54_04435 [Candidatus Yonathbacteria bacterium CG23_combo_of_CG06-09_8_20_14_all_46_18]PIQ33082.1 MAG: hypothetical protein COW61_00440 [Candidatus Yonathbacteria bacterium CG17_big_fil_post_rev_8_21_14_2_50_46_19]PIX56646.1 MAG: hypothetical protein COZ49_00965 [Candidatus Yonathbacteria bacterium CG_4_10_14_3_um_filter_47_65]PIY57792.1 MAG: hypothetical protein CO